MVLSDVDMERLRALCGRYGIARLDVFGSVARGEAGPGSDVDLLYALAPGRSLGWEIEDLSDALSELMGAPVDLVSRAGLHPRLRDAVLREARPIYAAARHPPAGGDDRRGRAGDSTHLGSREAGPG